MIKSLGSYLFMATYNPNRSAWFCEIVPDDSTTGYPIATSPAHATQEGAEIWARTLIGYIA